MCVDQSQPSLTAFLLYFPVSSNHYSFRPIFFSPHRWQKPCGPRLSMLTDFMSHNVPSCSVQQMIYFHYSLWITKGTHICHIFFLYVDSLSYLSWIVWQTWMCRYLKGVLISFPLNTHSGEIGEIMLALGWLFFWRNLCTVLHNSCSILTNHPWHFLSLPHSYGHVLVYLFLGAGTLTRVRQDFSLVLAASACCIMGASTFHTSTGHFSSRSMYSDYLLILTGLFVVSATF